MEGSLKITEWLGRKGPQSPSSLNAYHRAQTRLPHPAWPWAPPWTRHPQLLWATPTPPLGYTKPLSHFPQVTLCTHHSLSASGLVSSASQGGGGRILLMEGAAFAPSSTKFQSSAENQNTAQCPPPLTLCSQTQLGEFVVSETSDPLQ